MTFNCLKERLSYFEKQEFVSTTTGHSFGRTKKSQKCVGTRFLDIFEKSDFEQLHCVNNKKKKKRG